MIPKELAEYYCSGTMILQEFIGRAQKIMECNLGQRNYMALIKDLAETESKLKQIKKDKGV